MDYLFDRFVGDIPDNEVVPVQTKNGILARKDDFVGDDLDDDVFVAFHDGLRQRGPRRVDYLNSEKVTSIRHSLRV